jgi:hypothetical protein
MGGFSSEFRERLFEPTRPRIGASLTVPRNSTATRLASAVQLCDCHRINRFSASSRWGSGMSRGYGDVRVKCTKGRGPKTDGEYTPRGL